MGTRSSSRKMPRTWLALLAVFALVIPGYGLGAMRSAEAAGAAQATSGECPEPAPDGYSDRGDGTTTPYNIVDNLTFFDTKLQLDSKVSTEGFKVEVSGTSNYAYRYMDENFPRSTESFGVLGYEEDAMEYRYIKFEDDPSGAVKFGNFDAAESATIKVTYPLIGSYDGRPVGMTLVVSDIDAHQHFQQDFAVMTSAIHRQTNEEPIFQFAANPIHGVYFYNVHSANFVASLNYADTGEPLQADDIYLTQSSLSVWSYNWGPIHDKPVPQWRTPAYPDIREMTKPTTDIEHVYFSENSNMYTDTRNLMHFQPPTPQNGNQTINVEDDETGFYYGFSGEEKRAGGSDYVDEVGDPTFARNAVSFKYSDASNMGFKNATISNTMWFAVYPQGLANSRPPAPTKSDIVSPVKGVYGADEEIGEITGSLKPGSAIRYEIDQQVNELGVNAIIPYENFSISDAVPAGVDVRNATIYKVDADGTRSRLPSDAGTMSISGQNVRYEFSHAYLQQGMEMKGEHYMLVIDGVVRSDATGDLEDTATSSINHRADDVCDNNARDTNSVTTKVLTGDAAHAHLDLTNRDEVFTYTVSGRVPADAVKMTLSDQLESVLEVVEATISLADHQDKVRVDGNTVTFELEDGTTDLEKYVTAHRGEMVTLSIKAKIRDSVSDEELIPYVETDKPLIPNTGAVSFNDNPQGTNKVTVTPPTEAPEKQVNGSTDPVTLANRDDVFTYTVSQRVPAGASKLVFEDTLEDVLDFVGMPTVTSGDDTLPLLVAREGQFQRVTTEGAATLAPYVGTTVTMTFRAKLRDGVTDAQLIEKYGAERQIPNVATVEVNNKPQATNEVLVTPPVEPTENPVKKVDGEDSLTLDARDQEFTYTVSQKVPANASALVFEDTLEDVLDFAGMPTVTSGDDTLPLRVTREGQFQRVTTDGAETLAPYVGQIVTMTFKAKIREGVTDAQLIEKYGSAREVPNTATVLIDDDPKASNTVTVTPPPTPREDPVKKVNGKKKVTLAERGQEFTYTVSQLVPADSVSIAFEDTLEDVLEVVGTPTVDAEGAQVAVNDQTVTATLDDADAVKALWTKTVTLTIKAKIRAGVSDTQLIDAYGSAREVPNTATVTIDDDPKTTNTVTVTPPPEPREDPQKKVNEAKHADLSGRYEEFTYTVSQLVPADAVSVSFEDTLAEVLEVVSASCDSIDAQVDIEGQKVTATIDDADAVKALWGRTVTLTIKARLADGVTDAQLVEKYGQTRTIPNTASVAIDDDPKTTNTVTVTPPSDPRSAPVKKVDGKTRVQLGERYQEFTYTVKQAIPQSAVTASFEDMLEDVLEVVSGSATIDGQANYAINVEGQKVTATTDDARADRGATVTLSFKAKLKDGVTDAQLIEKYGSTTVPNTATVAIDDDPLATNTVTVTPPSDPREIPLKRVNAVEHVDLTGRYEEFTYTVAQAIPQSAVTASFTDTIEDVLEVVPGSVSVDGQANYAISVEGQKVTATTDNVRADRGATVTLSFKAKLKDGVTDAELVELYGQGREVPNTASVVLDDEPGVTNTVTVVPPEDPRENPLKRVNAVEHVDLAGRYEEFTYTVAQAIPQSAVTASFTDTIEDVLEVVPGSVTIDGQANYAISVEGQKVTAATEDVRADRGTTVTLSFKAKLKDGVTDAQLIEKYGSTRAIPNEASVSIDDDPKASNTVTVTPPPSPRGDPAKKVNEAEHADLSGRYEEFTYTVSQLVPADAVSVSFEDTLADVLEVVSASCDSIDAQVDIEGRKVTATIDDADAVKALWGRTVTLTIKARLADGVTDVQLVEKYGQGREIPNTATVAIDDDPKTTNTVTVVPPEDPREIPLKRVNAVEHADLTGRYEEFTYTVAQAIPQSAVTASFEDTLEDVLEVVPGSATIDGQASYAINVEGQKVTATTEDVRADRGATVTLSFKARLKDGITDAQLVEKYGQGREVPNTASVSIDDEPLTTNTVTVTPPSDPRSAPVKKVDGKTRVQLGERYQEFTYTVKQAIPQSAVTASFTDTLEDVLEVVSATVKGKAAYEVKVEGNKVTATADDVRKDRGRAVTLTIKAKLKDGVTDAQLIEKYGSTTVPNTATVAIDDEPLTTNTVTVTPPSDPREIPLKRVNAVEHVDLTGRYEEFTYTVAQAIPQSAVTASFTDTIEDVLEVVPGSVTIDGQANYAISVEGQKVSATTEDVRADRGATVTLSFKARLKDGVTDAQLVELYGQGREVPNTASVVLDDEPGVTNTVTVVPPEDPRENPLKRVNAVEHVDLAGRYEEFTYTVAQAIPQSAVTASFTDTIEDVLEVVPGSVTIDGQANYAISVEGQKVSAATEDVRADRGATVTLSFKAKLKDGVTDAQLIEKYGSARAIPNTASVSIDDDSKTTNTVTVTPPPTPRGDPVKKVDGEDSLTLDARGQEFTYTVSQQVPANAASISFEDTLEDVLEVVGVPSLEADGSQVSGVQVDVEGQKVTATIDDAEAVKALWAKTVTLTIKAKVKDGITDAELIATYGKLDIPNTATVTVDDNPLATNTVTVTPPQEPVPGPEKKVDGANHVDLDSRSQTFTYTVTQTIPANVSSVEFVDTLPSELDIVAAPALSADGAVLAGDGVTIVVQGPKVTATLDGAALQGVRTKQVTLTIAAQLRGDVTDTELIAKYGSLDVPNKAQVSIDGTPKTTETVTVTPPVGSVRVEYVTEGGTVLREREDVLVDRIEGTAYSTEQLEFPGYEFVGLSEDSAPASGAIKAKETLDVVYVYRPIETTPVKKIDGGTDPVQLPARLDTFTYTVTRTIPGGAETVEFSDTLEDVLEILGTPSVDAEGFTVTVDGQTVRAATSDAGALAGTEVTLTVQAKIRNEVKDAELIEKYGEKRQIPNVATVTIDGIPAQTNEVLVNPPLPKRGDEIDPFYVTISKTSGASARSELEGATLRLTGEDGTVWAEWVTGAEPWFDYIAPGSYTLEEIEVPDGYLRAEPISFTVGIDGIVESDSEYVDPATNTVGMVDEPVPDIVPTPTPTPTPTDGPTPAPAPTPTGRQVQPSQGASVAPARAATQRPLVTTGAVVGSGLALMVLLAGAGAGVLALRRRRES